MEIQWAHKTGRFLLHFLGRTWTGAGVCKEILSPSRLPIYLRNTVRCCSICDLIPDSTLLKLNYLGAAWSTRWSTKVDQSNLKGNPSCCYNRLRSCNEGLRSRSSCLQERYEVLVTARAVPLHPENLWKLVRMWECGSELGLLLICDESSYPNLGLAEQAVSRDEGYCSDARLANDEFLLSRPIQPASKQPILWRWTDTDAHSKPSEKNSDADCWSLHKISRELIRCRGCYLVPRGGNNSSKQ